MDIQKDDNGLWEEENGAMREWGCDKRMDVVDDVYI